MSRREHVSSLWRDEQSSPWAINIYANECVQLAIAVLKRAFHDLTVTGEPHAGAIRRDAHEFLTVTLWEKDCLWHDILGDVLAKSVILRAVSGVCRVERNGRIIPLKRRKNACPL